LVCCGAFHRCADRRQRRLTARIRLFQGWDGSSILLAATQLMSTQTIELEGFEIELASELYCEPGGDHSDLEDRARTERSVTFLGKKHTVSAGSLFKVARSSNWPG